ncbi:hypothetical protein D9M69_522440 [compost metagenome]
MMSCTNCGMLSRGVVPPDSICRGSSTSTSSMPNWGMLRASVAMKMPMEVVANRCNAAPARKSATDPSIGTCNRPRTTNINDSPADASTTSPIDQTLATMISVGVTGMTNRCSIVPCSRSRISAAPVRMMDSIVTLLMISISAPNQACVRLGLKRMRTARSTGSSVGARYRLANSLISSVMICWM